MTKHGRLTFVSMSVKIVLGAKIISTFCRHYTLYGRFEFAQRKPLEESMFTDI